jgi:hypothetical protein
LDNAEEGEYDLHDVVSDGQTTMEILQLGKGNLTTLVEPDVVDRLLRATTPIPTKEIFEAIPAPRGGADAISKARRHTLFFLPVFWRIDEAQTIIPLSQFHGPLLDLDSATITNHKPPSSTGHNHKSSSAGSAMAVASESSAGSAMAAMAVASESSTGSAMAVASESSAGSATAGVASAATMCVLVIQNVDIPLGSDVGPGEGGSRLGILVRAVPSPALDRELVLRAIRAALPDPIASDLMDDDPSADSKSGDGGGGGRKVGNDEWCARRVLLSVIGRLAMHPGSFVPTVQQFVSGIESVAKRLAICGFEDSYVSPDHWGDQLHLLGCALVAQRLRSWRPTEQQLVRWMKIAIRLHAETRAHSYTGATPQSPPPHKSKSKASAGAGSVVLRQCGVLLGALGGMAGDHRMVADIAAANGSFLVNPPAGWNPTDLLVMPWENLVDQHCAPSVAYYFDPPIAESRAAYDKLDSPVASKPFAGLYMRLFCEVTALNPRRQNLPAATQASLPTAFLPIHCH